MLAVRNVFVLAGLILATFPTALSANPEKDAVKAVIKAVKQGDDLGAAYPGVITTNEIASLQRVTKCSALNLMKQKAGYYTVVWDCGSKGALGMRVAVSDGKVAAISTMEIGMQPNTR